MKKITAKTLQEALTQASIELKCSVVELEYEIIQTPSNGFMGIGRKNAIIIANAIKSNEYSSKELKDSLEENKEIKKKEKQSISNDIEASNINLDLKNKLQGQEDNLIKQNKIEETFFKSIDQDLEKIQKELQDLLSYVPYDISYIKAQRYDNQTILIQIDGKDSALLIGEKGYRYKALSYLLFNWINPVYGYNIRLEIAEFLKNQEEAIDAYLEEIILNVRQNGKAQTKPLDGILAYIALKKLRELFPNKYVSFRDNESGEKYIIINNFNKK